MATLPQPPTRLRRARLLKGATLQSMESHIELLCNQHRMPRGTLNRGELSRLERGKRWANPWQLAALAAYHAVTPADILDWMLADRHVPPVWAEAASPPEPGAPPEPPTAARPAAPSQPPARAQRA